MNISLFLLSMIAGSKTARGMSPVNAIQTRVVGNEPKWDENHKTWVIPFGTTFDEQYNAGLDSVNTASVEGALMYLQSEGIIPQAQVGCKRKNGAMKYVVFYNVTISQPVKSPEATSVFNEYCQFSAMDGGKCNEGEEKCKRFNGDLGPCVGAGSRTDDKRAPYPGNYWYSYPGSCTLEFWKDKTPECRKNNPGGLCPFGEQPDGIKCTFSYEILGYLKIDDLVGITFMKSSSGNLYKDFEEFCLDKNGQYKGVEFDGVKSSIPFWENPTDPNANSERAQKMITMYNDKTKENRNMKMLPEINDLTESNPPCDKGCKRSLYSQICT